MENWIHSKVVYDGRILRLRVGEVRLEDGVTAIREVVEHAGGVGVVPFHDGKVFLVRQFRISIGDYVLELPAGRFEGDESPAHRAQCELEEEIGYRAGRLVRICSYHCSPGFTNEMDHLYLAFDLEKTQQNLDHDERVEVIALDWVEARRMLNAFEFIDAKTIIGLRELEAYLARGDCPA